MATGSLVGSVCYENVSLATDAYFAGLPASSIVDASGSLVRVFFQSVSGVWYQQKTTTDSAGVTVLNYSVVAPVPSFSLCYSPSEAFADGQLVGWAFCGLLVIVVFVRMAKLFFPGNGHF